MISVLEDDGLSISTWSDRHVMKALLPVHYTRKDGKSKPKLKNREALGLNLQTISLKYRMK